MSGIQRCTWFSGSGFQPKMLKRIHSQMQYVCSSVWLILQIKYNFLAIHVHLFKLWNFWVDLKGQSKNTNTILYIFYEIRTLFHSKTFFLLICEVAFHLMTMYFFYPILKATRFVTTEHGNVQNMTSRWRMPRLMKYFIHISV